MIFVFVFGRYFFRWSHLFMAIIRLTDEKYWRNIVNYEHMGNYTTKALPTLWRPLLA